MPSISHQQALADYIAMGAGRSLRRLRQKYAEDTTIRGPSFGSIDKWSRRYGWARRAQEHDEFVGRELLERFRAEAVKRGFDRIQALTDAARACLDDAAQIRLHGAGTVSDKVALIRAAIDALKMIEVLTGGVSDRREAAVGFAEEARAALRELEARKRGELVAGPRPSS